MPAQQDMIFVPYEELGDRPNIVVDGAGTESTLITLSHWPKSGTPEALKADSSAEIVFNYLNAPDFHVQAEAVSNNHFDEDGLVGVSALLEPEWALAHRDILVGVARAGDFQTCRERRAARIAFTLSAFSDPARSPLDPAIFDKPYPEQCADLYRALLPRLEDIVGGWETYRDYWAAEDAALTASETALRDGEVTIETQPEVDLAVVRVAEDALAEDCHPMAIHNATPCSRILTMRGRRYDLRYRYESWVQYISRPIPPRADLSPLADILSAEEGEGGRWRFDGVDQITPHLRLEGLEESAIDPDQLVAQVTRFLAAAPAAWVPFD